MVWSGASAPRPSLRKLAMIQTGNPTAQAVRKVRRRARVSTAGRRTQWGGLESLEQRQLLAATDPIINEFLANNNTGIVDDRNAHSDWIEIYNPGASAADLSNWHLTDSKSNPAKWTFPAGTSV